MERTLVVADVHADPEALDAVLAAVSDPAFVEEIGSVQRVVALGDLLGRGPAPRKVWDRWTGLDRVATDAVLGNHEEHLIATGEVLDGGSVSARSHARLVEDPDVVQRLDGWPDRLRLDGDVLAVHGGPVDPARLGDGRLARPTWQRIGDRAGPAADGHRITPRMAFDALDDTVGRPGLLLTGHEHRELVLEDREDDPAPPPAEPLAVDGARRPVTGRTIRRGERPLLVRLGLGAGWDGRADFGVVDDDRVHLLHTPV